MCRLCSRVTQSDCATIARLWNASLPSRYRVDDDLVAFNTIRSGLLVEEATFVGQEGFVVVKRIATRDPVAFVSCLGGDCDELLGSSRAALSEQGINHWQFGGEIRHFFPGVPADCEGITSAAKGAGMARIGAPVYDLERDLVDYVPPVDPCNRCRVCRSEDAKELHDFLSREFPGRWSSDVMEKFSEDPSRIVGLYVEGTCEGFAMLQAEGDTNRRAGAVWSNDLGPKWAALGPIGVSKSLRGKGMGHGLLAWSLCLLRDQGARRTIIDWTTLVPFYARHGFEPTREYATYAGPLK